MNTHYLECWEFEVPTVLADKNNKTYITLHEIHNTGQEESNITDTIKLIVTKTDNINNVCHAPPLEVKVSLATAIQCTANSELMVSHSMIYFSIIDLSSIIGWRGGVEKIMRYSRWSTKTLPSYKIQMAGGSMKQNCDKGVDEVNKALHFDPTGSFFHSIHV